MQKWAWRNLQYANIPACISSDIATPPLAEVLVVEVALGVVVTGEDDNVGEPPSRMPVSVLLLGLPTQSNIFGVTVQLELVMPDPTRPEL